MGRKSILSDDQKQYIRENYESESNKDIALKLNTEDKYVKWFADREGLRKNNGLGGIGRLYLSQDKKEYISCNYNLKNSYEIANTLEISVKTVNDYIYSVLKFKKDIKRQELNRNYFKRIDSSNKAYWLGFLYADGSVNTRKRTDGTERLTGLEVSLNSKDEAHLERLKMSLSSNSKIENRLIKNTYPSSRLSIYSVEMCKDLIKLGCTPRKSLTLTFPTEDQVPAHLQRDFIRGYFDGDGCIYVNKDSDKTGANLCSVSFVGTEQFLTCLQKIVCEEVGLTKTTIKRKEGNKSYSCFWGGESNVKTWYDYLYNGQDIIYLSRKKNKFELL